jgi:hypothetical protein
MVCEKRSGQVWRELMHIRSFGLCVSRFTDRYFSDPVASHSRSRTEILNIC